MRRSIIVLFLLAILSAVAWTLWTWVSPAPTNAEPWRAIPEQSAIIIEVPDAWATWDRFTHTSQLWGDIERIPSIAGIGRLMAQIQERMEQDAALRQALGGTSLLAAILRSGGDAVGGLVVLTPRSPPATLPSLAALLGTGAGGMATLDQGGILQVRPDSLLPTLSLCFKQGLWLLATSSAVMDEAILQLGSPNTAPDSLLLEARRTLGAGADAHVLVHARRALSLLNGWWTPEALRHLDAPANWLAFDLRTRADALLMSGLVVGNTDHAITKTVRAQPAGAMTLSGLLPASTSALHHWYVSQPLQWLIDRRPENPPDADLAQVLFNWVQGEVVLATAPDETAPDPVHWALFRTSDVEAAETALLSTCPTGGCDTLTYRGQHMRQLGIDQAHERLLGPAFTRFERPWWTLVRDVVVFAPNLDGLKACIDAWVDGNSLAGDLRTMTWFERIGRESSEAWWCDLARSGLLLRNGMKPEAATTHLAMDSLWARLGGISLQLLPGQRGYVHVMAGLQHAPLAVRASGSLWNTPIGSAVDRTPDILRNHVNNTREVLVQDVQHRIHLLASTGKVLWTRQLEGPILGEVVQVDRFRNGKLQMVFNTAERIHLIDRNGKDVGGFPLALPAKATAPLSVFDYDNERDYRVLVPCADGRIHNYALDGLPVKGWEAPRLEAPATNGIRHLRLRNKDYLLVVDGKGPLFLLDRRGARRESTPLNLGEGAELLAVIYGIDLGGTRMVWRDGEGAVHEGSLAGTRSLLSAAGPGPVQVSDLDGDADLEVLRIRGDSLFVERDGRVTMTYSTGMLLHSMQLERPSTGLPLLAIAHAEGDKALVLDGNGSQLPGMPMSGSTPPRITDLDLDDRWEAISVTKDGRVVAQRISLPANSP